MHLDPQTLAWFYDHAAFLSVGFVGVCALLGARRRG
jgi:hypothetical protein